MSRARKRKTWPRPAVKVRCTTFRPAAVTAKYASPVTAFIKVTLPLIWPGILAGFLLAFALSVDDFVITYLVAGADQTFPLFVWGAARVAVPPQINVIGSAIFFIAVAVMLANVLWQWRRQPKGAV